MFFAPNVRAVNHPILLIFFRRRPAKVIKAVVRRVPIRKVTGFHSFRAESYERFQNKTVYRYRTSRPVHAQNNDLMPFWLRAGSDRFRFPHFAPRVNFLRRPYTPPIRHFIQSFISHYRKPPLAMILSQTSNFAEFGEGHMSGAFRRGN